MAQQIKFFQDEMKKMQDEMSKMKEELSKKVEDAISGKNDATKDNARYNKNATLKATQQHEVQGSSQVKKKKAKDNSSSEEEDSDEEVAFVIKNLRKFMKKSNRKIYGDGKKRYMKRFCYGCGQTSHFIADCPNEKKKNKYNKDDDKKNKDKKRGEAHLNKEWDSNDSDSSDDEKKKKGAANIIIHHSSSPTMIFPDSTSPQKLFPNLSSSPRLFSNLMDNEYYTPTCLMDKGEKSEVQGIFKKFARRSQNEFDVKIKRVRSDNGTEFKNTNIEEFIDE
ncbi:uncharacterized protein [Miscanthus floridulus]|uniref:uncharacterized protein n=1 Tax=Miscanthus floridulus TaxID=154761 RepID=UPI00345ACCFE